LLCLNAKLIKKLAILWIDTLTYLCSNSYECFHRNSRHYPNLGAVVVIMKPISSQSMLASPTTLVFMFWPCLVNIKFSTLFLGPDPARSKCWQTCASLDVNWNWKKVVWLSSSLIEIMNNDQYPNVHCKYFCLNKKRRMQILDWKSFCTFSCIDSYNTFYFLLSNGDFCTYGIFGSL
jgi:hypothetical protein